MEIKKERNNKNFTDNKNSDAIGKIVGFFLFRTLINGYEEDKNASDEKRKTIKKYGIISLILSFIALAISTSCLFSSLFGNEFIGFSRTLALIIYIIGGVLISILLAIYGFILGIMQIRLNRKSVGVFGLILSILSIVASVLIIIFMFV